MSLAIPQQLFDFVLQNIEIMINKWSVVKMVAKCLKFDNLVLDYVQIWFSQIVKWKDGIPPEHIAWSLKYLLSEHQFSYSDALLQYWVK